MSQEMQTLLLLLGAYLLGSLPFGLWVVLWLKGVDVRTVGSKNIGATNVARAAGGKIAALVFVLDVIKGLLPPLIGAQLGLSPFGQILAALGAILGHNYSIFIGFKGGKGVATSLGALLGLAPPVGVGGLLVFLLELFTLRYVSLGSILAGLALPLLSLWFYPGDHYRLGFVVVAAVIGIYRHRANLQRLREGTEPKVNLGRKLAK